MEINCEGKKVLRVVQMKRHTHDCLYVAARNRLIDAAAVEADRAADKNERPKKWNHVFLTAMEKLWKEREAGFPEKP